MKNIMATKKTTWVEKRDNPSGGVPKVVKIEGKMVGRWGGKLGDTCAIAAPKDINEWTCKVPKGKLISIDVLRKKIAAKYKTDIACPITTGIFAWIVANAAEEEREAGKKDITPWWRILKGDGYLSEKYPGYPSQQKSMLEAEGHKIIHKGKRYFVEDYEKKLIKA